MLGRWVGCQAPSSGPGSEVKTWDPDSGLAGGTQSPGAERHQHGDPAGGEHSYRDRGPGGTDGHPRLGWQEAAGQDLGVWEGGGV